jgi:hypothetical protein
MQITKTILLLAVLAVLADASAPPARADDNRLDGYVCDVSYVPFKTASGTAGYVLVRLRTGNHCTGLPVGTQNATLHSTGSQNAPNPNFLYSEAALLSVYQSIAQAAARDRKILLNMVGATDQVAWVELGSRK